MWRERAKSRGRVEKKTSWWSTPKKTDGISHRRLCKPAPAQVPHSAQPRQQDDEEHLIQHGATDGHARARNGSEKRTPGFEKDIEKG